MKRFKQLLTHPWAAYTLAACTAVLFYMLLSHLPQLWGVVKSILAFLSPVIIGIIIAYLLNPLSEFFERKCFKKVKKESAKQAWGVALTVFLLALAIIIIIGSLIPSVIKSVSTVVANWNSYVEHLNSLTDKLSGIAEKLNIDLTSLNSITDNLMDKALNFLQSNKDTILSKLSEAGSSISNFAVGVLFGVCFLVAKDTILRALFKFRAAVFKKETIERNDKMLGRFNSVFIRYIGTTFLDALIVGVCTLIFMLFDNPSYAALIAVLVAITNIIPTFGPMIGAAFSIFFLVLDKPWSALWFFIFICVLQSIDGMIIKPRLFKGSLGISGVWTLVLIIIGGKLAGMMGIILSIPLAAMFVILYKETIVPRLENRSKKINK